MPKLPRPDGPSPDDLLSAQQAAEIARRHVRTIHRAVADGQLKPAAKVPGKTGAYLFRRSDVEAFAAKQDVA